MANPKPCAHCGTVFTPTRENGKYCHEDCKLAEKRAAYHAAKVLRTPASVPCAICGTPFTPNRSPAFTCSNACRLARKRQQSHAAKRESRRRAEQPDVWANVDYSPYEVRFK